MSNSKDELIDIYFNELTKLEVHKDFKANFHQEEFKNALKQKTANFIKNEKEKRNHGDWPEGEKSAEDLLSLFESELDVDDTIRKECKAELAALTLTEEDKAAIISTVEDEFEKGISYAQVNLVLNKLKETKPEIAEQISSYFGSAANFAIHISASGKIQKKA